MDGFMEEKYLEDLPAESGDGENPEERATDFGGTTNRERLPEELRETPELERERERDEGAAEKEENKKADGDEDKGEDGKSDEDKMSPDRMESENESEIDKLRSELEETKNSLAAARSRKRAAEDAVLCLLPVLDNLDRALCVPEEGSARDVLVGVRMVRRQFLSVLEDMDITPIPAEGCSFDPSLHDAVETEYIEEPSLNGAILSELLSGYKSADRVLRPAQVRVGKLKAED